MKQLFTFILCLMAGAVTCVGAVVPQSRAEQVASSFFREMNGGTKSALSGAMRLVATFPEVKTKVAATEPTIFVFEHEAGGFVLVSGEDAGRPVLAYSLSERFPALDQMPVNMRDMLDFYSAVLYRARVLGWKPSPEIQDAWNLPTKAGTEGSMVVLQTAKWNQWSPYNDLCPKVNGQEVPCGCVATAIGIIMRYHKWPAKGTGTLPAYDYGWDGGGYLYHIEELTLGHTYNWDAMSEEGSFSQEGRSQVAQLMRDLGVMCQMDYDPAGSGASSLSPIALAQYFDYDKQMRYYDREDYTAERWEELIRDEIDRKRPVFHCGSSSDGGHAFVIDGYNGRFFRINYGWGGAGNAFYTLSPVDGYESDLTEFSKWQDMVCWIMPNQGGTPYVYLDVSSYEPFTWDYRSETFIKPEMTITAQEYASTGNGPTDLCYCLYDKTGQLKEVLSEIVTFDSSNGNSTFPSVVCRAPSQIADGDIIQLSRPDERYQWIPISAGRMYRTQFDTTHPLSALVSIGHTYGYSWEINTADRPALFFRAYKDLYWEVRRVRDGRVLMTSITMANYWGHVSDDTIYTYSPLYRENPSQRVEHSFQLPAGEEYELFFRNIGEEMTLRVVL